MRERWKDSHGRPKGQMKEKTKLEDRSDSTGTRNSYGGQTRSPLETKKKKKTNGVHNTIGGQKKNRVGGKKNRIIVYKKNSVGGQRVRTPRLHHEGTNIALKEKIRALDDDTLLHRGHERETLRSTTDSQRGE